MAANLAYDRAPHVLAELLRVGMPGKALVRPARGKHPMSEAEIEREYALQHQAPAAAAVHADDAARGAFGLRDALAWALVGIPFLIGVWIAITRAAALF